MKYDFASLATTDYGNVLGREHFIDISIKPLWQGMKRIFGPAYTVQLASGDNLMLHSAIYEAPKGSVLVVDGFDNNYAVAGGNVCAVAKERGIQGFIIDGVIRDLDEIRELEFPVYAKGVFPVPGKKKNYSELFKPILCGGVNVRTGDIVVADSEGIAIIPIEKASEAYDTAKEKLDVEQKMSLLEWRKKHQSKIEQAIAAAKDS